MIRQRYFFICLAAVVFGVVVVSQETVAGDYVWARTGFGAVPMGQNVSSFSNGYGGYYVPRNAHGNNYESRRPFTNPTGYIIPAEACPCPAPQPGPAAGTPVQPSYGATAPTTNTVPIQPGSVQQLPQSYRLTRFAPTSNR